MAKTADQIVGNRLKPNRDVILHQGHPGSGRTIVLSKGRLTPPVYSWIQKSDGLYWMFNEVGSSYFLKHDPSFKVVPDSGGASFLEPSNGFNLSIPGFASGAADTAQMLQKVVVIGGVIGVGLVLFRLKDFLE